MIYTEHIVTRRAPLSPTAPVSQRPEDYTPLPSRVGAPVLVDGAHCPSCCAPVFAGRRKGSVVCVRHGFFPLDVYRNLWRRLNGNPHVGNADKMNPIRKRAEYGGRRPTRKTSPPAPSVSG
jgi:hypothetical protein